MSKGQQKLLINFGKFLVLLFVGLTLGGFLNAFVMPYIGMQGTFVGEIIAFVITGGTAYVLLKKLGKKSLN